MVIAELILKQLSILLISAVKFLVAAPTSYLFGYTYIQTILNTTIGGWIGVIFFYYTGRYIFSHFPFWKRRMRKVYHRMAGIPIHKRTYNTAPKKIFTKRNRIIVMIRSRFGFPGLIILTPVLLSIPLGTFLAVRYYSSRRGLIGWLSLSVMAWSVIISTFIKLF
ncbi:MAG TPA: hypothetical protein VK172_01510 [Lentimicrobium sp.]|jgi:hypothetical protein|nr:hypothetical protein [Bacteroidales bacterium]HLO89817.1 hypothetical protein [Lentimicrobium sp.]